MIWVFSQRFAAINLLDAVSPLSFTKVGAKTNAYLQTSFRGDDDGRELGDLRRLTALIGKGQMGATSLPVGAIM